MDPRLVLFYRQYLQQIPQLAFPRGRLLVRDDIQENLYDYFFNSYQNSNLPPARYQIKVLKVIVDRIENSIRHPEYQEVTGDLLESLTTLLAFPRRPAVEEAQETSVVTYFPPLANSADHFSNHQSHIEAISRPILIKEARNVIGAGENVGLRTWEAALRLACYLTKYSSQLVKDQTVLELGAGTGLLSILCASHLGASRVVATDYLESILDNLRHNIDLNTDLFDKEVPSAPTRDPPARFRPPPNGHYPDPDSEYDIHNDDDTDTEEDNDDNDNNHDDDNGEPQFPLRPPEVAYLNWLEPTSLEFTTHQHTIVDQLKLGSPETLDDTEFLTPPSHISEGTRDPSFKPTLLLGADITYSPDLLYPLANTIKHFFTLNPTLKILISATQRNVETLEEFLRISQTEEMGFEVVDVVYNVGGEDVGEEQPDEGEMGMRWNGVPLDLRCQTGFFHDGNMDIKILELKRKRRVSSGGILDG